MNSKTDRGTGMLTVVALLTAMVSMPVQSAVVGYTTKNDFDAAVAGWIVHTTDFEAVSAATLFNAGTGPSGSGFTLTADAQGAIPMVSDVYWASSGAHYLGLDNGDTQFLSGDQLQFNFDTPTYALGLYVLAGSDLQAHDMRLHSSAGEVFNGPVADLNDGHGSFAFFLGLIAETPFTTATLTGVSPGGSEFYLFAVDDVLLATPVPLPAAGIFMLCSMLGVSMLRLRFNFNGR